MTTALSNTLFGLTGKYSLDEIYTEELVQLVKDYPYFAPAQIALAAKYKSQGHVNTQTQIQKTGLFVSNTKWLQFQLMDLSAVNFTKKEPSSESTSNNNLLANIDIPSIEDVKQMMGEKPIQKEILANENSQTEHVEVEPISESPIPAIESTNAVQTQNIVDKALDSDLKPEELQELPVDKEENTNFSEQAPLNDIHSQISKLKEQWHKPVDENEKLTFETDPYYTIDYFESQGIKFDYKSNANDDLTKKMLKFTDWLKRMKNPSNKAFQQTNEQGEELDKAIQGIAQSSNQPKEIVTETMAEIFEKQGDLEKAIQLYIKLSFLNPQKTAYFAARIQKLKGI